MAKCFVQHSIETTYGDREGIPVAIIEACSSRLPVISTKHTGIREVINHGENRFLVDENDIESMAEYMIA